MNDDTDERTPWSRLGGGLHIGPRYFERRGLVRSDAAPRGLVDRLTDLANDEDVADVPAPVAAFFLDTAALELRIDPAFRLPLRPIVALVFLFARLFGQFVQPTRPARISTRVFAIDRARDGRADARAVVRTYPSGGPMQVVAYATARVRGVRLMSAVFPLPIGHLVGLLRLEIARGEGGRFTCARLTTARRTSSDPTGVWLSIAGVRVPLPLRESLCLSTPEGATPELPGATILGEHDQWLFGVRVVRYRYWFRPQP
ncbi:MAG: hypothetical protein U0414_31520 [Polyangiaceae bacterium]